ncbi:MAG: type II secretion system protein [Lachnospiraceae bacterium]|nr:type II secretion system protein [Lachnospiraceae bacterium]
MNIKSLKQSNKGFTLVEICVVMVIFSILASITTMSLISWQEYSTYTEQEEKASLVYMAARNKIAQLKSNNALEGLEGWGDKCNGNNKLEGITYTNSYITYPSGLSPQTTYYTYCTADDYEKYLDNTLNDPIKKLLFDLTVDYVYDKNMLKANISIEYSADGTIHAVYYSDRTKINYASSGLEEYNLSASSNRTSDKLYENIIGAYLSQ